MPRRVTQHAGPPTSSRENLLDAWLGRYVRARGDDRSRVRKRLKDHVGMAADWFADIPPVVCRGRGQLVGWKSEPVAPSGDAVALFTLLLDRMGPLAVAVVARGKAILHDDALRGALARAGVSEGPGKQTYTVADYTDYSRRGERIFAALSEAIATHVREIPAAAAVLTGQSADPDALIDVVADAVTQAFVARAAAEQLLVGMPGFDPRRTLRDAEALCQSQCPAGRVRREVSEARLVQELAGLDKRWESKPRTGALEPEMTVRFAHSLIDPQYYPPRLQDVVTAYEAMVLPRLRGQARRNPHLIPDDWPDVVQASALDAWKRLQHALLDAYVDPLLEPEDWDRWLRQAVQLRGVQEVLVQRNEPQGGDPGEAEKEGHALTLPWDRPWERDTYQPGDLDPVERDYWRNRDLALTKTPEYAKLIKGQVQAKTREPWRSIDEIVFLTKQLLEAADEEMARPSGRRPLTVHELNEAQEWIDARLERLLKQAWDRVSWRLVDRQAKSAAGTWFEGLDLRAAVMGTRPEHRERQDWWQVSIVVERAVLRAVVVVYGRRAIGEGDGA